MTEHVWSDLTQRCWNCGCSLNSEEGFRECIPTTDTSWLTPDEEKVDFLDINRMFAG